MFKVWHDDIRKPPSHEWLWARTNDEAAQLLRNLDVAEISLDHDLGMDGVDPDLPDAIYLKGNSAQTGLDLVDWMVQTGNVPDKVTIHSWNPAGAQRMLRTLQSKGYHATYRPYEVPR